MENKLENRFFLIIIIILGLATPSIFSDIVHLGQYDLEKIRENLKVLYINPEEEDYPESLVSQKPYSYSLWISRHYYLGRENWVVFDTIDDVGFISGAFDNLEWYYLENPEAYGLEVSRK